MNSTEQIAFFNQIEKDLELTNQNTQHAFNHVWLSSISALGAPSLRSVILRSYKKTGQFMFYTDVRSPKWQEIAENNLIQLGFYDQVNKVQIRVKAHAELIDHGPIWDQHFKDIPSHSLMNYSTVEPPSQPLQHVTKVEYAEDIHFGIILAKAKEFDILKLHREQHQRIQVQLDTDQNITSITLLCP